MADIQPSLSVNHNELVSGAAPNLNNTPIESHGGLCDTQPTPWQEPLEDPLLDLASDQCIIPEDKE